MELGDRISGWLAARGISVGRLAQALGVTRSAVFMWVGGDKKYRTTPSRKNLEKLYEILGVTETQFYGRIPKARLKASALG